MNDLFGGDDSEGDDEEVGLLQALWIELMKLKPTIKKRITTKLMEEQSQLVLSREIILVGSSGEVNEEEWLEKLKKAGFVVRSFNDLNQVNGVQCDVLVLMNAATTSSSSPSESQVDSILPAGAVLLCAVGSGMPEVLDDSRWIPYHSTASSCLCFRKRGVCCNSRGAIYWGATGPGEQLDNERALLEELSVQLSVQERSLGIMSDESHRRAQLALQKHGLVVMCGLVSSQTVMAWGDAARADMAVIVARLKDRGIDLLNPGTEGQPRIENFHEMSMREALRCDIRNGRAVSDLAAKARIQTAEGGDAWTPASLSLNAHPAVRELLVDVMNPPGDPVIAKGNWGRWNFEGLGPDGPPPDPTVGQVGTVMSLPGCADQTIHADTAHLYVHTQLPGHYYNLFFPAVSDENGSASLAVGQTAFVVGSHELATSALVMTQAGGQEELNRRLVRPHLRAGDALLFDCRILHFGLANQSIATAEIGAEAGVWRPLLYVNYHQPFYVDPKNWNDRDRLFE